MNNYYWNNYYSDDKIIGALNGYSEIIEKHITKKYIFALNKTNKSCSKNNTLT